MAKTSKKLTLIDHLAELRKRLTIIVIVNIVAALICYQFMNVIMQLILALSKGMDLVYISPSELFLVYVKLALICGIVVSSPITLLQVWIFISKGLYKKEKIYLVLALIFGVGFFVVGVNFCYKTVLPTTINFFVNITIEGVKPMISVQAFVSFISSMLVCFGVIFEMPIVIFILSVVGLVKPKTLLDKQPIFIVGIFIAAAFITPPDVVSQMLLGIPMVLLFELSIGISWVVYRFKKKKSKSRIED